MLRLFRFSGTASSCYLSALLLAWPGQIVEAQTGWDRYEPGTIAAVMQKHDSSIRAEHVDKHPSLVVSGDAFPTLARVIYRGDSRPLDSGRLRVLREWGLTFRDSSIVRDFHREYLFQEGRQLIWLPVQDTVATYFPRELRSGEPVTLYVAWLGAYYEGADITWMFIVNEFNTRSVRRTF